MCVCVGLCCLTKMSRSVLWIGQQAFRDYFVTVGLYIITTTTTKKYDSDGNRDHQLTIQPIGKNVYYISAVLHLPACSQFWRRIILCINAQ